MLPFGKQQEIANLLSATIQKSSRGTAGTLFIEDGVDRSHPGRGREIIWPSQEIFLPQTNRRAPKVFRNAILCWSSFKKRLCRGIVFQVAIQEVQCVERNPGTTRVGVIPSVIGYLIFGKALRALPAAERS
jgi:hypothetical protein